MEEKDDLLSSKYNMARKSQEQMFDVIDKGKYVKVKNVFTQLGLDTPDDMLIKIKEYEIKSDNLLSNNKTQEKKIVDVSDVIENKNITSTKTQIDFDYTKYKGACDILPLPSQGKIHPKNKEVLEVAFLTAIDESLFMQANLSKTKDIFNLILRNKIIDKDVDVNLLHHGDKNAILVFLRSRLKILAEAAAAPKTQVVLVECHPSLSCSGKMTSATRDCTSNPVTYASKNFLPEIFSFSPKLIIAATRGTLG